MVQLQSSDLSGTWSWTGLNFWPTAACVTLRPPSTYPDVLFFYCQLQQACLDEAVVPVLSISSVSSHDSSVRNSTTEMNRRVRSNSWWCKACVTVREWVRASVGVSRPEPVGHLTKTTGNRLTQSHKRIIDTESKASASDSESLLFTCQRNDGLWRRRAEQVRRRWLYSWWTRSEGHRANSETATGNQRTSSTLRTDRDAPAEEIATTK